MAFQIADRKQVQGCIFLSLALGALLAVGFQPTGNQWMEWILSFLNCQSAWFCNLLEKTAFPLLALFFYFSLPQPIYPHPSPLSAKRLCTLSILPVLIAGLFGKFKSISLGNWEEAYWTWLAIPLGEELLFRGWLTSVLNRVFRDKLGGATPLFPLSLWGSSIAFAIWHIQNGFSAPLSPVLFQVFYTFFAGIWLGFLRWNTGKVWPCVLAHFLINFAADWKLWFVV